MLEHLFERYQSQLASISLDFIRGTMDEINWDARMIGIRGARGVGKTTLLLQFIKRHLPLESSLYVSLDHLWFTENRLITLVDHFAKRGGRYLFVDEVHKYPDWARELKNIYDGYPELKLVFTGSSLLEILNARADLSRRAIVYEMQGLSFREYLNMETGNNFPVLQLQDLLRDHQSISREMVSQIKPLKHFEAYLHHGYYPFYHELPDLYYRRIEEVLNMILEIELPLMRGVDMAYVPRLRQILQIISTSAPFVPNVSKLSERVGINRSTFLSYLFYLQEAHVINAVYKKAKGISRLQKPDKIFLENTNQMFALAPEQANRGNIRETFFVNQLGFAHEVAFANAGDFWVNETHLFEVGGKKKTARQLPDEPNAFVAADDLEHGFGNRIPLWLFGFLY